MKIIQNTLKIEEKFSDVPKKFRVGPKNVGSIGFPETRHFFFALCFLILLKVNLFKQPSFYHYLIWIN